MKWFFCSNTDAPGLTRGAEIEIVFIPRYRDKADEVRLSEERQISSTKLRLDAEGL